MKTIVPGDVVQISPKVRRITAPNPGLMTGPGTNTYLIGERQIAVVDPGPCDANHVQTILNACSESGGGKGKLCWIIVTHTHRDHSPAAKFLAEQTGAQLMGNALINDDGFQDESFQSSHRFYHDELLVTEEFTLRALHTPGHVENHLCFLVEEDGVLLTGDHIMQGSTVVIVPPHGDMQDYIASLKLLLDYPINVLGPGHGTIINEPSLEIEKLVEHRLGREAKVLAALEEIKVGDLEVLTKRVYDDVDSSLHAVARYSLWAHLIKLEKEARVIAEAEQWRFL